MSGLDVGIILLAVAGAFLGLKIGVVSASFNIAAGFAGTWAASRFYLALLQWVPRAETAYVLVFLPVAGCFVAAGILLSHVMEKFFLGLVDKFLGALLGVFLTLLFATVALIPSLLREAPSVKDMMRRSAFAPHLMRSAQKKFHLATPAVWGRIEPWLESDDLRRVRKLIEASK